MAIDTILKRYSAMNIMSPWRGVLPLPDGSITQGDRQVVPFLYSGILASGAVTIATLTGTLVPTAAEGAIRVGGGTIVITLSNDTWVAGGSFTAVRQAIINGFLSAGAEAAGWNAVVRAGLGVAAVVRTSATVVTITLTAFASYDITAQEIITGTIPSAALTTSLTAVIATPTFRITAAQPVVTINDKHDGVRKHRRENEERKEDLIRAFNRVMGIDLPDDTPAIEVVRAVERAVIKPKKPQQKSLLREAHALREFLGTMERADELGREREAEARRRQADEEDFIVMMLLDRRLH